MEKKKGKEEKQESRGRIIGYFCPLWSSFFSLSKKIALRIWEQPMKPGQEVIAE